MVRLKNLTRLNLKGNPITDKGIEHLNNLQHLEVLNLFETNISKGCFATLKKLPELKRVYVWKTNITADQLKHLKNECPHLEIIGATIN